MKKAQMEMFGLVIIVVIIVFSMLFLFNLRSGRKEDVKDSYIDTQLAQNMLNVMMKMQTDCGLSLTDVIRDCADKGDTCGEPSKEYSCGYAEDLIDNILTATLKEWRKSYRFTIRKGDEELGITDLASKKCSENDEKEAPGFLFIPYSPTITVRLDICKR